MTLDKSSCHQRHLGAKWDPSRATLGVLGARWGPDTSKGTELVKGEVGYLAILCCTSPDGLLLLRSVGSLLLGPLMLLQRSCISESVDITQAKKSSVKTLCGP